MTPTTRGATPPPATAEPDRLRSGLERSAFALAWLVVVALLALGAANAVTGLDHQPGTDARPELTWAGDSAVGPVLHAATDELEALLEELDTLGVQGRGALAAMTAREFDKLDAAVTEGSLLVTRLRDRAEGLRGRLTAMTGFGPGAELRLSDDLRARRARILDALDATTDLDTSWARLAAGGVTAARVSTLLDQHDARVLSAIEVGSIGSYPTALRRLGAAVATLDEVDRLRVQLENTSDVATLVEWMRRNREYDAALIALYEASLASPDRVTPEIRAALVAEAEARERLPETDRPLSIVMADIAQGGVNQAVIAIEEARGEIALALDALRAPEELPAPSASAAPDEPK